MIVPPLPVTLGSLPFHFLIFSFWITLSVSDLFIVSLASASALALILVASASASAFVMAVFFSVSALRSFC